ncbi:hypothetical protein IV203_018533 [Nitzschia inconspicua]|uniref:DNA endonuclease activator Ctp1 C-terminal domain-containing protein n=1 Tax=Nitzschia inconspicua TaxID=303405 RepID=A0A9K3M305_9STRA|nr:hypothetical protein IV203_018533 [Nitzschia inconspicua]
METHRLSELSRFDGIPLIAETANDTLLLEPYQECTDVSFVDFENLVNMLSAIEMVLLKEMLRKNLQPWWKELFGRPCLMIFSQRIPGYPELSTMPYILKHRLKHAHPETTFSTTQPISCSKTRTMPSQRSFTRNLLLGDTHERRRRRRMSFAAGSDHSASTVMMGHRPATDAAMHSLGTTCHSMLSSSSGVAPPLQSYPSPQQPLHHPGTINAARLQGHPLENHSNSTTKQRPSHNQSKTNSTDSRLNHHNKCSKKTDSTTGTSRTSRIQTTSSKQYQRRRFHQYRTFYQCQKESAMANTRCDPAMISVLDGRETKSMQDNRTSPSGGDEESISARISKVKRPLPLPEAYNYPLPYMQNQVSFEAILPVVLLGLASLSSFLEWWEQRQQVHVMTTSPLFQSLQAWYRQRDQQYHEYIEVREQKHAQVKDRLMRYHKWAVEQQQRKPHKPTEQTIAAASTTKLSSSRSTNCKNNVHRQPQDVQKRHREKCTTRDARHDEDTAVDGENEKTKTLRIPQNEAGASVDGSTLTGGAKRDVPPQSLENHKTLSVHLSDPIQMDQDKEKQACVTANKEGHTTDECQTNEQREDLHHHLKRSPEKFPLPIEARANDKDVGSFSGQLPTESLPTTIVFPIETNHAETTDMGLYGSSVSTRCQIRSNDPPIEAPLSLSSTPLQPFHPSDPQDNRNPVKLQSMERKGMDRRRMKQSSADNLLSLEQQVVEDASAAIESPPNSGTESAPGHLSPRELSTRNYFADAMEDQKVRVKGAVHQTPEVQKVSNHYLDHFYGAESTLPMDRRNKQPIIMTENMVLPKKLKQRISKRPLHDTSRVRDDADQSIIHPTQQSEVLLSQLRQRPSKSRRITASPRKFPMGQTDGPMIERNQKNVSVNSTAANSKWISNEPARQFVSTTGRQKFSPCTLSLPQSPCANRDNPSGDANEKENSVEEAGDFLLAGFTERRSSVAVNQSGKEKTASSRTNHSDDLMDDSSHEANEPDFKYLEVVRKKAEREGLNPYDCPECAKFFNAVTAGDAKDVYKRDELMGCSRHRGRSTPPQTPEGFWEMSFIDEKI